MSDTGRAMTPEERTQMIVDSLNDPDLSNGQIISRIATAHQMSLNATGHARRRGLPLPPTYKYGRRRRRLGWGQR